MPPGVWSRKDPLPPMEAVGRQARIRRDDARSAAEAAVPKTVMIDATSLKAHRTATSLRAKKGGADNQQGRLIGRTKGALNSKLHAVTDADGRPIRFFMTAGQVSDYTGAAAMLSSLPAAEWLLGDRGYEARTSPEPKGPSSLTLKVDHDGSVHNLQG